MVGGYYYKRLKTQDLPSETCLSCDVQGSMQFESGCRVHHQLFIPVWANKKCTFLHCKVCKQNHSISEYPHLSEQAAAMYKKTRYRWYHYIGTVFAAALIISTSILIYLGEEDRKNEILSEIENISTNDVIYYKLGNKEKTSMYVDAVVNDTVFVRENRLSTNKNVSVIDNEHNYTEKQSFYLKSTLLEMHKDGKIIRIYQSNMQLIYDKP